MAFFAKCFKHCLKITLQRTQENSKIQELKLNEVHNWLTKETESTVKSLNGQANQLLHDIKSRLDELFESSEKLIQDAEKEMARGSRKTFRRAKFLFKLAGNFSDLIDEVVIPDEINSQTLGEVSEKLTKAMEKINQEKNKWFKALAPYFILSRRRFDASYKKAEDPYQTLIAFLSDDYSKAVQIESVPQKIVELQQVLEELKKYNASEKSRTDEHEKLEKQIKENQQKLKALQNQSELFDLAQLNSKINELTGAVKYELRHLEKSLLKFQTLVSNPGYSLAPDANSKLAEYQNNPFEALATEKVGYPLLKSILQKIDTALNNKKMKLKPSRLRKAKEQIVRIVQKDVLLSLQRDCTQFFDKKRELLSSGALNECKDEKAELQDSLKSLEIKKSLLEAKNDRLSKEHEEAKKRADEQKKELESLLSTVTGSSVKIVLD
ncbi:MAG: hypothetical protein IAX21_11070 [Candidatus Bathyarchaeota archaeon]|nr:MAG: hypothetical protein IAX21_11070 [Candidatus Bathyarchaeota archaeon]